MIQTKCMSHFAGKDIKSGKKPEVRQCLQLTLYRRFQALLLCLIPDALHVLA